MAPWESTARHCRMTWLIVHAIAFDWLTDFGSKAAVLISLKTQSINVNYSCACINKHFFIILKAFR